MNNEEDLIRQIDFKTSLIIEDIPYLLVFSSEEKVYRIYFINLNLFDSYKNGVKYKPLFMEIFSLFKEEHNLFLGIGNYRHLSNLIPRLLNQEIVLYSLRMNGKPFKSLDPVNKIVDCYKFRKEKIFFSRVTEKQLLGYTKFTAI
jgi:hypothetical protein